MSKKLPIDSFEWNNDLEKFTSEFIRNYDENDDIGYLLEVDIDYPKTLHDSHRDLPFLPIKKDKLLTTLEDKERELCCSHFYIKSSIKSWFNILKST